MKIKTAITVVMLSLMLVMLGGCNKNITLVEKTYNETAEVKKVLVDDINMKIEVVEADV